MKKIVLCAVAGVWFLFAGCFGVNPTDPVLTFATGDVVVKTYSGAAYVIDRTNATLTRINIGGSGSRLVAIGSNITSEADVEIVDLVVGTARQIRKSEIVYQVRIGDNTNPQDIVFESATKAYITQLGGIDVLVVNPVNGSVVKRISLARFNNSNTVPCASSALIYGAKLYVACQRLTAAYAATLPGVLAIISTAADSVVDSIELVTTNPYSMDTAGSTLYVSMFGDYKNSLSASIETVNLLEDSSIGILTVGTSLKTNITELAVTANWLYAVDGWSSRFFVVNRQSGAVIDSITLDASGSIVAKGNSLYIGDRTPASAGIATLNTLTNTLAAGRIKMSMPPYSLAILE